MKITDFLINDEEINVFKDKLDEGELWLSNETDEFSGWVNWPENISRELLKEIKEVSGEIRKKCSAFVVIGIGGSYLGARAAIEMLTDNESIFFAGYNLSAIYHKRLLEKIENEEVCLLVISKSGRTTESSAAFALLKDFMEKKYGKEEAAKRIYCITDEKTGDLRKLATEENYRSFSVPEDIGGRYSVLTQVGLLPMAVAGIDIFEVIDGALPDDELKKQARRYAAIRNVLYRKGKKIEVFEYYEPQIAYFAEWLKQLFGESEGKEGKGIFPASLEMTRDLHSMGQYLQEGEQIFFETILDFKYSEDILLPKIENSLISEKSMNYINEAAKGGVKKAHLADNIPIINIETEISSRKFGRLCYFFQYACALSAYILDVNPFNQPGVEKYKSEMRTFLEKK